jgi:hypothetical protein
MIGITVIVARVDVITQKKHNAKIADRKNKITAALSTKKLATFFTLTQRQIINLQSLLLRSQNYYLFASSETCCTALKYSYSIPAIHPQLD